MLHIHRFVLDETSSHAPWQATIIGLIVGVALLAVVVVAFVIRMKRKSSSEVKSRKEVGIDNFANGVAFVGK